METLTPSKAKRLLSNELQRLGLNTNYTVLSSRTVSFVDLARGQTIFVRVHGWKPNPLWSQLEAFAKANGFLIE